MKKLLLAILIVSTTIGFYACTSEHIVTEQPVAVEEVQGAPPGASYVWENTEYTWEGGRYVSVPGRWVVSPHVAAQWVPGHWNKVPKGYVWVRGHWN